MDRMGPDWDFSDPDSCDHLSSDETSPDQLVAEFYSINAIKNSLQIIKKGADQL